MYAKLLALLLSVILVFIVSIWSMIDGWGLTPKNWTIIILAVILNVLITGLVSLIKTR